MTRRIKVRPYTRRNGTKVKGHTKGNPQSTRRRKQIKKYKAAKRLGGRLLKRAVPAVAVAEDIKDTADDLNDLME